MHLLHSFHSSRVIVEELYLLSLQHQEVNIIIPTHRKAIFMEVIQPRANGTLLRGLIRCILRLEEVHTRKVEVLLGEVSLHRILYLVLVLVLVGEVILHRDLRHAVKASHLIVLLEVCPKALLLEEVLDADGFHPRALLQGEVLVVVGFHLSVLLQEVEVFLPKVPLVEALVKEVPHI